MKKLVLALLLAVLPLPAQALEKKRDPANIIVTVQGILAGIEGKKIRIKTANGHFVYVPRQRIELRGLRIGFAKVSARMTMRELASLNH